jgi:transposase-like protein
MAKRKYYTPEFKVQAARMAVESSPPRRVSSLARERDCFSNGVSGLIALGGSPAGEAMS